MEIKSPRYTEHPVRNLEVEFTHGSPVSLTLREGDTLLVDEERQQLVATIAQPDGYVIIPLAHITMYSVYDRLERRPVKTRPVESPDNAESPDPDPSAPTLE